MTTMRKPPRPIKRAWPWNIGDIGNIENHGTFTIEVRSSNDPALETGIEKAEKMGLLKPFDEPSQ